MKKRILSLLLAAVMLIGLLPTVALADVQAAAVDTYAPPPGGGQGDGGNQQPPKQEENDTSTNATPIDGIVMKINQDTPNDEVEAGAVNKMKIRLIDSNTKALTLKNTPANSEITFDKNEITVDELAEALKPYVPAGYVCVGAFFYWNGSPSGGEDFSRNGVTHVTTFKNYKSVSPNYTNRFNSHLGFKVAPEDREQGNDWQDNSGYYAYDPTGTLRVVYEKIETNNVNGVWVRLTCNVTANHSRNAQSKEYKKLLDNSFNLSAKDSNGHRTLTIKADQYVADFNESYPNHTLKQSTANTATVTLEYNEEKGAWVPVNGSTIPVQFEVQCPIKTATVTITKTFTGEGFQQTMVPNNFGLTLNKVEDAGEGEEQKKTPQTLTKGEGYTWTATLGAGNYEITESNADVDGWTRTTTGLTFSVTEDDIKKGTKSVTVTNTYTKYTSAEVDLSALIKKTLEGDVSGLTADQKKFTVKLTPVQQSGTTYVPIEGGTAITGTADCSTNTTVAFGSFKEGTTELANNKLTFSGEQPVYYKVEEDFPTGAGSVPGMTYDANKYILTITVTKDELKNQYTATSTITDEFGKETYDSITFTNKYEPITFNLSGKIKKTMEFGAEGATDDEKKNSEDAFKLLPDAQKTFTVKLTRGKLNPAATGDTWESYTGNKARAYYGTATIGEDNTVSFSDFYYYEGTTRKYLTNGTGLPFGPGSIEWQTPSGAAPHWSGYDYYLVEEFIPDISRPDMTYDTDKYVLQIVYKSDATTDPVSETIFTQLENDAFIENTKAETITFTNKYVQPSSSAVKTVLTTEDKSNIPEGIDLDGVNFPTKVGENKTQFVVDRTVNSVTFAYTVTVTGNNGARTFVSDAGATYVGYTVSPDGAATVTGNYGGQEMIFFMDDNVTVTLYYTKTFTRDETTGKFPAATNTAKVNGEDTNTTETEIKDKEPGGFDFSDIILKDLYVTGDQNFPSSLTFRAELKFEGFEPETPVEIQSLDPTEKSDKDEVVEAFGPNWTKTLTATFYPENVTFDKENVNVKPFLLDGSHLYVTFPAAGTYTFTLEEIDDKQDGVKYDRTSYIIYVTVEDDNNGGLEVLYVTCTYAKGDTVTAETLYSKDHGTVGHITFFNEADTGDIPYYPIIPILPTVKDEGKLNKTDHFAYIIGYPDGTVHPNGEITRAEVATIFFRLLKDDVRNAYFTSYNNYSDVSYGKWYNNPISTMSALGIINGYPDGTFRPDAPITRAEFAAIAARFDETATRGTTTFTDVYGHWAADEIAKAYGNDWIKGYPDGTFRPDRNITRAEAMALINRVLDRRPESPSDLLPDMNKWSDNMDTSKWYYLDIQEATNSHDYTRKTFGYEMWKRMLDDPDWSRYER